MELQFLRSVLRCIRLHHLLRLRKFLIRLPLPEVLLESALALVLIPVLELVLALVLVLVLLDPELVLDHLHQIPVMELLCILRRFLRLSLAFHLELLLQSIRWLYILRLLEKLLLQSLLQLIFLHSLQQVYFLEYYRFFNFQKIGLFHPDGCL